MPSSHYFHGLIILLLCKTAGGQVKLGLGEASHGWNYLLTHLQATATKY